MKGGTGVNTVRSGLSKAQWRRAEGRRGSPHTDMPVTYLPMLPSPFITDDHVFPHLQLLKYLKGWSGTSQLKEQTCKLALERQMSVINTPRQESKSILPSNSNLPFKGLLIVIQTSLTKLNVYYPGICENHTYFGKLFYRQWSTKNKIETDQNTQCIRFLRSQNSKKKKSIISFSSKNSFHEKLWFEKVTSHRPVFKALRSNAGTIKASVLPLSTWGHLRLSD